jgi:hypothetical protein
MHWFADRNMSRYNMPYNKEIDGIASRMQFRRRMAGRPSEGMISFLAISDALHDSAVRSEPGGRCWRILSKPRVELKSIFQITLIYFKFHEVRCEILILIALMTETLS